MLKTKLYILLIFCLTAFQIRSQSLFYQDNFKGEVVCFGYSTLMNVPDTLFYDLQAGSNIKSAYLFHVAHDAPLDDTVLINSFNLLLSMDQVNSVSQMEVVYPSGDAEKIDLLFKDITNLISAGDTSIILQRLMIKPSNVPHFSNFYFIILAENPLLEEVNTAILLNTVSADSLVSINIEGLNPIESSEPVAFAIHSGYHCLYPGIEDGSTLFINSTEIGHVYGEDENNLGSCQGVRGDYGYYNSNFYAFSDDTANQSMEGADGLADISPYLSNQSTNFDLDILYTEQNPQQAYASKTNPFFHFFMTYHTSCDAFSVDVPSELNICKGDSATIQATGGNNYEWTPQIGLSCYNCPNPIVTADSNMFYSLRVWNTDSCSKVLPIKINVLDLPEISNVTTWNTPCTDSIGHFLVEDNVYPYASYTLNDTLVQPYNHFYFLPPGVHDLVVSDTNSCKKDTVITINSFNDVVASFTANPMLGEIPFEVSFINTSSAATNYIWYVENDTLTSTNINHTFIQEGSFDVTLVAIDQYPTCSDTASVRIIAETPFSIFAPTIVNQSNGNYSITISGTSSLEYNLFDDLGHLLFHQNYATTSDGLLSLWPINKVSKGIYFYTIHATSEEGVSKVFSGKVVVM